MSLPSSGHHPGRWLIGLGKRDTVVLHGGLRVNSRSGLDFSVRLIVTTIQTTLAM